MGAAAAAHEEGEGPQMTVYIATRGRQGNIRRIVPKWLDSGQPVRLFTEDEETDTLLAMIKQEEWGSNVRVSSTGKARGIGAIRNRMVRHAARHDELSIILAEDDASPHVDSDWEELLRIAALPDVLGIGATRPLHDRFSHGFTAQKHGPILCPGGWGFVLHGLNVPNAIRAGNYDPKLHTIGDDAELARNGIAQLGIPWLVHCDVRWDSLGTRYAAGGINARFAEDLDARAAAERQCFAIIHERWPAYTNEPGRPLRVQWQKMLDDYLPEWRKSSAMHGGRLRLDVA
jgi:hypothetical protein